MHHQFLDYVFRELAISYLGKEELAHTPSIASSKSLDTENGDDKFLKIVKNITSKVLLEVIMRKN